MASDGAAKTSVHNNSRPRPNRPASNNNDFNSVDAGLKKLYSVMVLNA